jgi:hypothetical protein
MNAALGLEKVENSWFRASNKIYMPVTVAVRSEAWVLGGWLLGSWVRILLKAWMFVRVFLCCVVLCRYRPCDGLFTHPRSPTICINSSGNLLYVRRSRSFKDCTATGEKNKIIIVLWESVILLNTIYKLLSKRIEKFPNDKIQPIHRTVYQFHAPRSVVGSRRTGAERHETIIYVHKLLLAR